MQNSYFTRPAAGDRVCHTGRVRPHLATLVADFRRYGDQIAIVTHRGNRRFSSTYAALAELSARCAAAFEQAGVQPGDRILLWGNNSVEWVAAFFGCILRGIVAVPLDAAGSTDLARRVVAEVQPRLLVGDLALLKQVGSTAPVLDFASFASLPAPNYEPYSGLSRETPLQIVFTSGTTAEPKGIVHTQGNVLASLDPLEKEIGKYLRYERWVHPLRILHTLPAQPRLWPVHGAVGASAAGRGSAFRRSLAGAAAGGPDARRTHLGAGSRAPGARVAARTRARGISRAGREGGGGQGQIHSPSGFGSFAPCTASWVGSSGPLFPAAPPYRRTWKASGPRLATPWSRDTG